MDLHLIGIKAFQLICCLSLLVVLHEGGHFGFARLFGVRVERFYMFFNWKFHLFSTRDKWFTRLFPRFKTNQTEYGIGWIPLGGYCEIAGMVDETTTEEKREANKNDERPEELFMNHSVWHRFWIMFGGVLVNFLTAMVIYCAIAFTWGEDVIPVRDMNMGFQFNEVAKAQGFRNGDIPVAFDGKAIENYNGVEILRGMSDATDVTVLREGKEVVITQSEDHPNLLDLQGMIPAYCTPYYPAVVDSVMEGTPAAEAGIKAGASFVSIDGVACETWSDFDSIMTCRSKYLADHTTEADSLRMRTMTLAYRVAGETKCSTPDTAKLVLSPDLKMGVVRTPLTNYYTPRHIDYDILTCIPAGFSYGWQTLCSYVGDLKYIFTKKGADSVGSFVTIGSIFPETWNWYRFWNLTALISIILAVMNILPIPGLDGGHIMLLLFEKVTGHEPSERAQVITQYIGMGILLALMLLAFGNDIRHFVLPMFGL